MIYSCSSKLCKKNAIRIQEQKKSTVLQFGFILQMFMIMVMMSDPIFRSDYSAGFVVCFVGTAVVYVLLDVVR